MQLGWANTPCSSSIQPIPEGSRFELILMLRDLPYLNAEGSGDLVEIRLLVRSHQASANRQIFLSSSLIEMHDTASAFRGATVRRQVSAAWRWAVARRGFTGSYVASTRTQPLR